jgi:hypothetical protein
VVYRVLFVVFSGIAFAFVAVWIGAELDPQDTPSDAEAAEAAALNWVRRGVAQEPRRDGDHWEVDVVRPDGSMVQVRLGPGLELRDFDEEFGPAGSPADDELRGAARAHAVRAAFAETGLAQVISVERDSSREIEVSLRLSDDRQVEVELDQALDVVGIEEESRGDD